MSNISGLRRVSRLAAVSVATSVVLAVGLGEFKDWSYQRWRERIGDEVSEATRHWRPTAEFFEPAQMVGRQPVVRDFQLVTVDEASKHIKNPELVLGAVINGETRAYPINVMTGPSREIFNDELGGRAIAATW